VSKSIIAPSSLRINSLLLALARITAQGLAVLFNAILARKLGVQDFGRFALIASLIFIGNTFTNFGTDTFLVRETARANKVTDAASRSLSLQIVLTLIYCGAIFFLRNSDLTVYALALLPMTVFSVNNALLRGAGRFGMFWFLSLANAALQLLAAIFSKDVATLCLYLLLGQILLSGLSLLSCRASLLDFRLFPLKRFDPIFKPVLPFAALTALLVLIQRLGILITSSLLGDAETGMISSVIRVIEGLKLGHYAILGALLPALSQGAPDSWKSFRQAFLLLMSASLLFSLFLIVFSKPVIQILYGSAFIPASSLLSLLGWSLVPYTVSSFISYDLIARGKEALVVKSAFYSLLLYLLLYLILIPAFGLTGAIWAALIGEGLQGLVFIVFFVTESSSNEPR
jgi:PST family polysaccharide transporter